ncbi:hypothetical protein ACHEXK_05315 [Limnohabitans sp. DCL3]|uniref:hypothetical protein n=1 Tax=Limnohabitans sp. DCL3 TaxID=3374103 RepID=UPI003A85A3FD
MRQTTRSLITTGAVLAVATLAGCALPAHNNTLIFAVHRKVGLDVTPTSGTNAGLTVGYSSNEFAWVPLWANDADGKPFTDCDTENKATNEKLMNGTTKISTEAVQKMSIRCAKDPKFVAIDNGTNDRNKDSYSVFASFGGDINAGSGTENTAGVKVASFFATGMAAQNLSENDAGQLLGASTGAQKRKPQTPEQANKSLILQWLRKSADEDKVSAKCIDALLQNIPATITGSLSKDLDKYSPEDATTLIVATLDIKAKTTLPEVAAQANVLTARWDPEYQKHKNDVANKDKKVDEMAASTRNILCQLPTASAGMD